MIPSERTWQLVEAPFIPDKLHHTGTIYTVGKGYMGIRATFEEGYPGELVSTLMHGVYDHAEGELVPELVNIPNPLPVTVEVDGEPFHMQSKPMSSSLPPAPGTKLLGFRRILNLKEAILERSVVWRNSQDTIVQITFE